MRLKTKALSLYDLTFNLSSLTQVQAENIGSSNNLCHSACYILFKEGLFRQSSFQNNYRYLNVFNFWVETSCTKRIQRGIIFQKKSEPNAVELQILQLNNCNIRLNNYGRNIFKINQILEAGFHIVRLPFYIYIFSAINGLYIYIFIAINGYLEALKCTIFTVKFQTASYAVALFR